MPEKYHINTHPVPPRRPRIGKNGVVDWREDCANCHNCVKKACVYDRYKEESKYIRGMSDMQALFFQCNGCFSCVQQCTKGLLALSLNPVYERMGNDYWTPGIIETTWYQAETASIPVSGAGYRGKFSGNGFDSMWTDMSEIVRPTRDGIHGREYISTAVDIGRKPSVLFLDGDTRTVSQPPLVNLPMPMIIDMMPSGYRLPNLLPVFKEVAARTNILLIVDSEDWAVLKSDEEKYLPHIAFYLNDTAPLPQKELLQKTRLAEISDSTAVDRRIKELKDIHPELVIAVRVELNSAGVERAIELAQNPNIEVIHVIADTRGNEVGIENPRFVKDMVRQIHNDLVAGGIRNEITLIAGGGIALAEHMAKQIICGADLVTINLPLLIALECQLCEICKTGLSCPARIDEADFNYSVGRMTNLIAAWHDQLIEVMGAMGIRDVRRLRGEVGRALFFEDLEEATFGRLFGSRKSV
ncbi:MAG: glutamate synthase-related protein [Dehalococcoidia bacterium]